MHDAFVGCGWPAHLISGDDVLRFLYAHALVPPVPSPHSQDKLADICNEGSGNGNTCDINTCSPPVVIPLKISLPGCPLPVGADACQASRANSTHTRTRTHTDPHTHATPPVTHVPNDPSSACSAKIVRREPSPVWKCVCVWCDVCGCERRSVT